MYIYGIFGREITKDTSYKVHMYGSGQPYTVLMPGSPDNFDAML